MTIRLSRPLARLLTLAIATGTIAVPDFAHAAPTAPPAPPAAAAPATLAASATADATVKAAVESTVAAIRKDPAAQGGDPARTAQLVRTYFLPFTDFRRTARLASGAAWAKATPKQQDDIAREFQELLVTVYAAQLTQIQGQNIQFKFEKPATVPNSTDMVVKSQVHTDTDDMETRYRLEKTPAGYRVYDIDLMGIWLIQVYRQQFADQLRQGGPDALIKYLRDHNAARTGA